MRPVFLKLSERVAFEKIYYLYLVFLYPGYRHSFFNLGSTILPGDLLVWGFLLSLQTPGMSPSSSRNLKKDEDRPIVKFLRRQTNSGLMANKDSLDGCEEKIINNDDDITLLRARVAKALRLRPNIKSVAMVNDKVLSFKTYYSKITFEKVFKYLNDPCFKYPACKTSLGFCQEALSPIHLIVETYSVNVKKVAKLMPLIMLKTNGICTQM